MRNTLGDSDGESNDGLIPLSQAAGGTPAEAPTPAEALPKAPPTVAAARVLKRPAAYTAPLPPWRRVAAPTAGGSPSPASRTSQDAPAATPWKRSREAPAATPAKGATGCATKKTTATYRLGKVNVDVSSLCHRKVVKGCSKDAFKRKCYDLGQKQAIGVGYVKRSAEAVESAQTGYAMGTAYLTRLGF